MFSWLAVIMAEEATTMAIFKSAILIYLVGGMLGITAAILLIVLTRAITRKQYELRTQD